MSAWAWKLSKIVQYLHTQNWNIWPENKLPEPEFRLLPENWHPCTSVSRPKYGGTWQEFIPCNARVPVGSLATARVIIIQSIVMHSWVYILIYVYVGTVQYKCLIFIPYYIDGSQVPYLHWISTIWVYCWVANWTISIFTPKHDMKRYSHVSYLKILSGTPLPNSSMSTPPPSPRSDAN